MRRVRRTEITVETDEILIISNRAPAAEVCPVCGGIIGLVTSEQAAALTSVSPGADRAEEPKVRARDNDAGLTSISLSSLYGSLDASRSSDEACAVEEEMTNHAE